jgi:hypothetical protein
VRILVVIASVILLVELGLTALSAGIGLQVWLDRMHSLARVDLSRSAQLVVFVGTAAAAVLVVWGFFASGPRVAGGALAAVGAALVLVQQLRHSDPIVALLPYLLFFTCGLVLAVSARL